MRSMPQEKESEAKLPPNCRDCGSTEFRVEHVTPVNAKMLVSVLVCDGCNGILGVV